MQFQTFRSEALLSPLESTHLTPNPPPSSPPSTPHSCHSHPLQTPLNSNKANTKLPLHIARKHIDYSSTSILPPNHHPSPLFIYSNTSHKLSRTHTDLTPLQKPISKIRKTSKHHHSIRTTVDRRRWTIFGR